MLGMLSIKRLMRHRYHLVTLRTARRVQLFAAFINIGRPGQKQTLRRDRRVSLWTTQKSSAEILGAAF
jgi:hypothetical protein